MEIVVQGVLFRFAPVAEHFFDRAPVEHRVDQGQHSFTMRFQLFGQGLDGIGLAGLMIGRCDVAILIHEVVFDQETFQLFGQSLVQHQLLILCLQGLAGEIFGVRLLWTGRKVLDDLFLERSNKALVALGRNHGQDIDFVDRHWVVHPLAIPVHGDAQPTPHLLAAGNRVLAIIVLEHAHHEDIGVVPTFA